MINNEILKIMSENKLTQAWLAKETGLSTVTISNILNGKSTPSIENAFKITKALNISLYFFINEKEPSPEELYNQYSKQKYCPYCGKKIFD